MKNFVIRKKFSIPLSGAQTTPEGQLSSQLPVGQPQSRSFTDAISSRAAPSRSVDQPCQVLLVERSTSSRCNRRTRLANQNRWVPSAERQAVGADSVTASLDPGFSDLCSTP